METPCPGIHAGVAESVAATHQGLEGAMFCALFGAEGGERVGNVAAGLGTKAVVGEEEVFQGQMGGEELDEGGLGRGTEGVVA